ncbi:MAG: hypothetical protein RQ760_12205 [Sedimentisphaerales bacterium]|nr:hypothetical protein [Sedimentisphaerales bacterium]
MNFWINFWTAFFIISLVLFAGLAVTVTIGGFFNIRSLFKNLTSQSEQSRQTPVEENTPAES